MADTDTRPIRERKPSMSAPISDIKGPIGPAGFTRPKHKRTVTGFGPGDIKSVEASIPEPQRAAYVSPASSVRKTADQASQMEEIRRSIRSSGGELIANCRK